jgi:hypothetical protein
MQGQVDTDVFIVRIWKEPREAPDLPVLWRGTVEHVASRTVRHIAQLDDLVEFLAATAGLAGDGRPGDDRDAGR